MSYKVKKEDLSALTNYHRHAGRHLHWPVIFILPAWIKAWWSVFGENNFKPALYSVWQEERLIGLAPLMFKENKARLIGSKDVCDYLDFIVSPGEEATFFKALLPALATEGIDTLVLEGQRPEAKIFSGFFAAPKNSFARASFVLDNVSSEVCLAGSFDEYLQGLDKKQRHEVRRKLRKLENETKSFKYSTIGEHGLGKNAPAVTFFPRFLALFNENPDKADFMTAEMKTYFRELTKSMGEAGLLRFGLLEVEGKPAAAVLYFVYDKRAYLYNSGYLNEFAPLSVGQLSKVLCLKDNISRGVKVFDFLKGPEVYKTRLGGRTTGNYTVTLELRPGEKN